MANASSRPPAPQQISLLPPDDVPEPQSPHHQELDRLLKTVMDLDQGRVLRWIFLPELCQMLGVPHCAPVLVSQMDKDFASVRRFGDYLLQVLFAALALATHFEFQKRRERAMGPRMARYQVAARLKHSFEVFSLVLNMSDAASEGRVFHAEHYPLGPLSQIGWVEISVPRLVASWPAQTDSPMAEVLRALVTMPPGSLDPALLRGLIEQLQGMGLSYDDCRQMMQMLSFLHQIQGGARRGRHKEIVDEVLAMLELEDSFIYQAAKERYLDEGKREGKRIGLGEGTRVQRKAVADVCKLLGLQLTDAQRAQVEAMDLLELDRLREHLIQARSWPAS